MNTRRPPRTAHGLAEAAVDACVVMRAIRDADDRIIDLEVIALNDAALRRFGDVDPLGTTVRHLFPEAHAEQLIATCGHVCEEHSALRLAGLACAPEPGASRGVAYDVRVVPLHDGVAFHWRDAAAQQSPAVVLAQTERRYRILAENASDVVCLADADDRLLWVSPSVERMFGHRADDLVGQHMGRLVHPDDLERVIAARARVFDGASETVELRILHADGHPVWSSCRAHPMIDDSRMLGAVIGIRDIEAEVTVRRKLQESERRFREAAEQYRLVVECMADAVLRSRDGEIIWVSPPIEDILGRKPSSLVGTHTESFIHPDDLEELRSGRRAVTGGAETTTRFRALHADGEYRWIDVRARPYRAADGSIDGVVSIIHLADSEVAAQRLLEHEATHDPLTGLANRSEAFRQLEVLRARTPRTGDRSAVLYCDIDRFKEINDTWGHAAGDTVLTTTAERMLSVVRSDDLVARIGGDEILVVLDGVHDLDDAMAMAERLRRVVAEPITWLGSDIIAALSVGVALAEDDDTVDAVVERADAALYSAKAAGRDRTVAWVSPVREPS